MKHNNIFGDFIKRTAVLLSALFVIAATAWAETITLTSGTGEVTLQDGDVLTGTGGADTHVTIADGAAVTLSGVDITAISKYNSWAGITCLGDATITLADGTTNSVTGGEFFYPGIYIPADHTLTIQGNGSLEAAPQVDDPSSQGGGAGIGAIFNEGCGNIVIKSGKITARGSLESAGIGTGKRGSCGNITITGGIVTAQGGEYAAGIGSGRNGSCGNVTITGGIVTAQGGKYAAGIGSGNFSNCSNITIEGGIVTATGGDCAAGIGSGRNGSCGNITIKGGIVTAQGGIFAAGIGCGEGTPSGNSTCGDITITLGVTKVTVMKSEYALHSIGVSDEYGVCGTVTIGGVEGAITESPYTLKTTAGPDIITLTSAMGEVTLQNGDVLMGTGGTNTHVIIADGAAVTLSGVDITAISKYNYWAGITCLGDATITLADGTTNSVTGGDIFYPGIYIPADHTLTIQGNGSLEAATRERSSHGRGSGAGIGGIDSEGCGNIVIKSGTITAIGSFESAGIGGTGNSVCGNITIEGGIVTAQGGKYAAGIGSGRNGSCGNVTITGGIVTATGGDFAAGIGSGLSGSCGNITIARTIMSVTATKGTDAQHSIGMGDDNSTCGMVTICDVVTGPISESPYARFLNSTIHFEANNGSSETMDNWTFTWDGTAQAIPACTFTAPEGKMFVGWSTEPDGSGTYYTKQVIEIPSGTLFAIWRDPTESVPNGELTLYDDQILTGTGGTKTHVTIADGATVTLSGVDITAISTYNYWAGITCLGDATIILSGENAVKGGYESAGIFVPEGRTLTIKGEGSLTATSNYAAGIGCGEESSCGNIVIEGGTITATGKDYSAGIGSGEKGSCGNIVIKGGTITATGKDYSAGIGSGYYGSCGNIVIEGGTVTATGGLYAPGIGSGYGSSEEQASCGDITIARTVTSVTATKGNNALHSIGEGKKYSICGTVTIGGATGPISESTYIYNPNGSLESTIHFDKNNDNATGTMDDWHFTWDGQEHAIPACTFTGPEGTIMRWNTKADGSGIYYTNGQNVIDILSGTLYAIWQKPEESVPNGELTLYDGQILTGTGGTKTHVTIADGATVTLRGVNITTINNSSSYQWAGITCLGDATIILSGENAVKGGYYSAGITVPEGHTLTIKGDGSLTATGRNSAAGIGSGEKGSCGNIIIEEGTITATGGRNAAGIGSGKGTESTQSSCGDITINGGAVIATSYEENMSIGSGQYGTCGTITVGDGLTDKTVDKTRYITVPDWTSTTSVTLAKEGYGTYYGLFDLVLPAGMKARIVTASADGGQLTYETIANGNTANNIVPALTAVMLQTAAADGVQTFDVGITVPTVAAINQTNLLHGSERETNTTGAGTGGKYYKLSYNTSGEDIGWYWGAEDGATFRSAANKAWLALPPTAAAREFFGLPENYDSADGIENVNVNDNVNDNAIYNLAGQKLSRPQKGINIVNGRKVLF
jgi:hypothetical protein